MTDFSDMLSKAKKMQERMKEVQKTLENIEVEDKNLAVNEVLSASEIEELIGEEE